MYICTISVKTIKDVEYVEISFKQITGTVLVWYRTLYINGHSHCNIKEQNKAYLHTYVNVYVCMYIHQLKESKDKNNKN